MFLPIEKQVCSVGLSIHLKELGVSQESEFFYWTRLMDMETLNRASSYPLRLIRRGQITTRDGARIASAFTVAELGEMLLPSIDEVCWWISGPERKSKWSIMYMAGQLIVGQKIYADTEADARAKMLIYLIENKLVTVDEINQRMAA